MATTSVLEMKKMEEKYKEILITNGITDPVSQVSIEDAGLRGEGFNSLTKYVTIKFEDVQKEPLNLFAKVPTGNPSQDEVQIAMKSFEKEARFFNDFVPEARAICERKGFPDFMDFYPKCYYADADEKLVVLENLALDKGYKLLDKQERHGLETAKVAITTIAKHHAVGQMMITESGGKENFFNKFVNFEHEGFKTSYMLDFMQRGLNSSIKSKIKILKTNPVVGGPEAVEKLEVFLRMPFQNAVPEKQKDGLFVLVHGDYWNNNMMYLYDKAGTKIAHHVAIDFQAIRYDSPAIDLGYFLYTSVQLPVRQQHLKELLTLYMETLNKATEDFGCSMDVTYDKLYEDYRKKMKWGFWFGFMMTVGAGMGLFKDVDMSKVDVKTWEKLAEPLLKTWLEENPDKARSTAEEVVLLMREFEELVME